MGVCVTQKRPSRARRGIQWRPGLGAPLPLAGEVDALGSAIARPSAAGGGFSPRTPNSRQAPPPQPSPASGRGSALPLPLRLNLSHLAFSTAPETRDTSLHQRTFALAARCARAVKVSSAQRAWGMPGARCTRSLVCEMAFGNSTRVFTAVTPKSPGIPTRNGFTVYFELSPAIGSFATVALRIKRFCPARLSRTSLRRT